MKLEKSFAIKVKKNDKVVVTEKDGTQHLGVVTSVVQPDPNGWGSEREGTVYVKLDGQTVNSWSPRFVVKINS